MGGARSQANAVISGVDKDERDLITKHCFWMTIFALNNKKGGGRQAGGPAGMETDRERKRQREKESAHFLVWCDL